MHLLLAVVTAVVVAVGGLAAFAPVERAEAADGKDFQPGYIISDSRFYDSRTMSSSQIQSFLEQRVPTCREGYTCLKDYWETTRSQPARAEGCAAYAGTRERASQIIYKVATACGINPQALLVLLEKEQGLVTDSWPTSRQYRSATGYGCPDTADCDTTYYGFGNQVYHAAWQFRKYRAHPEIRAYQAGRYNTILWHPNSACGSSSVYIRNQATAGLYSYTPYRPNAAALANLYGTGDGCSSYGNRNFWRIFTDWFGSTIAIDGAFAISSAYQAAGGSAVLGTRTTGSSCAAGATSCWVQYTKGVIHWTSSGGAIVVSGAIATKYLALGGVAGFGRPTSQSVRVTENGGGTAQAFAKGLINAGPSGAFVTSGVFRTAHGDLGGVRGAYGWPLADAKCGLTGGGCSQSYQGGTIYAKTGGPVHGVPKVVDAYFQAKGGPGGPFGWPNSRAVRVTENGGGYAQSFERTLVNAGPAGPFRIDGAIRTLHSQLGGVRGRFGWPIAEARCSGGVCTQSFQNGTISSTGATTGGLAYPVLGAIRTLYDSLGGPAGSLGQPTSRTVTVTENGGGTAQSFEHGLVNAGPKGAFVVKGTIRTVHAQLGGVRGAFGWPVAAEACVNGACSQAYQGGTIYADSSGRGQGVVTKIDTLYASMGGPSGELGRPISASVKVAENGGGYAQSFERGLINAGPAGPFVMTGAIRTEHAALGGVRGRVGWPNSPVVAVTENGGGQAQSFQNGLINAGPAGAFLVQGDIRTEHTALGGVRGAFGWPTGDQACGLPGGGCSQPFQGGTVYDESARAALGVVKVIDTKYRGLGGPAGALGWPRSASVAVQENGGGHAQAFANALINAGPAGPFVVAGAIRERHAELGGVRGSYGWPTGDERCTVSNCSQPFQGGTITVPR